MRQKTIVGLIMAAGAALMIAVGGWVMALIVLVLICFGVQEEFHALAQAGHRPVAWPTWVGMIVSIPLTLLIGTKMILPVIMAICLMTMICVIFRSEPKLDDAVLSMLPMLTVALPGMSAISFTHIEPKALQVTLITLMIGIPCMADAFAMWVGKAVKGPKLCPTVSPNKTISGAIGGVVGALLTSILIGVVAGCIIAGITCGIWYSQMKTAKLKTEANDFFDDSSFRLTEKRDRFLHTSRSVVLVETEKNDHDSFGGGGSFVDAGGFGGSSGGKF